MRRPIGIVTIVALILAAALATGHAAFGAAQDEPALAGHPVVGTWILTDTDDPEGVPFLAVFTSDGVYQQVSYDGFFGYGVWEATGPASAALTFMAQVPDDAGEFGGSVTVRAALDVADDGQSLTASYTVEFVAPDGSSEGEQGPGEVTGTKMTVQPMGTPVAPFEFDEATPTG
jgi:hypothetical protein